MTPEISSQNLFSAVFFWFSSSCLELALGFLSWAGSPASASQPWGAALATSSLPCPPLWCRAAAAAELSQHENGGTQQQLVPGHTGSFLAKQWAEPVSQVPEQQPHYWTTFLLHKIAETIQILRQRHMFKPENCLNCWMPQMSTRPATPYLCR